MAAPNGAGTATVITVVHARACHYCDDADQALVALAHEYPLVIERIAADEPLGRTLVFEHRAPMFPLVLVDGVFFSFGRLPRKKLRKLLDSRRSPAAVA